LFSCLLCGLKKGEDREDKLNSLRHDDTNDVHFKLLAGIFGAFFNILKIALDSTPFFIIRRGNKLCGFKNILASNKINNDNRKKIKEKLEQEKRDIHSVPFRH